MASVVTVMASWLPDSWNDRLRWARCTARACRSPLRGDVRVDLAAFQRGERELGRDGHRGACREDDDGEHAQERHEDAHDGAGRAVCVMRRGWPGALLQPGSPGRAVGTVRLLKKGCPPSVRGHRAVISAAFALPTDGCRAG